MTGGPGHARQARNSVHSLAGGGDKPPLDERGKRGRTYELTSC